MIEKNKIKNFVFDLDGTLLTSKKYFTQRTLKALEIISKQQKNIIIATGRAHYLNLQINNLINITHPLISSNGALIYDFKTKEIVKEISLPKEAAIKVYEELQSNNFDFLVYTTDVLVISVVNKTIPWYVRNKGVKFNNDPTYNNKPGITSDELKNGISDYEISKFLIFTYGMNIDQINKLSKKIMSFSDEIYTVSSEGDLLDVMAKEASKGNALEFIAKKYKFNLNETIVFGDADNDVSMFEKAKISVAMGNAVEKLKKIATFTTVDNDNDGVAKFLEEHFL